MANPRALKNATGNFDLARIRSHLQVGQVIPAMPLALDSQRRWSPQHQRAVARYYLAAGAGGLAVGVHSTQFEIRHPQHALFEPVLKLVSQVAEEFFQRTGQAVLRVSGLCGLTPQALAEAALARQLGYHAGLLSLGAFRNATPAEMLTHCRAVSEAIPIIGFYLQPAVGGRLLSYEFWRQFADIEPVVAIKIAPFNRYQTWDVVRAVLDSGREDIALYTGNDDNIIADLLTPWEYGGRRRFIAGGLLGQFGVWTRKAVELFEDLKRARQMPSVPLEWWTRNAALTDANAAIFDPAHQFAGCLPGIHEVLRRQGLFPTNLCLNPEEKLSPGQAMEISRVIRSYPWLVDDAFVTEHLQEWLR